MAESSSMVAATRSLPTPMATGLVLPLSRRRPRCDATGQFILPHRFRRHDAQPLPAQTARRSSVLYSRSLPRTRSTMRLRSSTRTSTATVLRSSRRVARPRASSSARLRLARSASTCLSPFPFRCSRGVETRLASWATCHSTVGGMCCLQFTVTMGLAS